MCGHRSGEVECRPGVLRMMDEARAAGLKLAVCSAGTKSSIIFSLKSLIGEARFQALDLFLAGQDPTFSSIPRQRLPIKRFLVWSVSFRWLSACCWSHSTDWCLSGMQVHFVAAGGQTNQMAAFNSGWKYELQGPELWFCTHITPGLLP